MSIKVLKMYFSKFGKSWDPMGKDENEIEIVGMGWGLPP